MPPSGSDPSKRFCECEKCRRYSPDGKVIPERTWYRHNPGGRKARYGGLTDEQIQAIDRIVLTQSVPRPRNGSKAQKRRHPENEEDEVSSHPSKRVAGSGSNDNYHMRVSLGRETTPQTHAPSSPALLTPEPGHSTRDIDQDIPPPPLYPENIDKDLPEHLATNDVDPIPSENGVPGYDDPFDDNLTVSNSSALDSSVAASVPESSVERPTISSENILASPPALEALAKRFHKLAPEKDPQSRKIALSKKICLEEWKRQNPNAKDKDFEAYWKGLSGSAKKKYMDRAKKHVATPKQAATSKQDPST